MEKMPYYIYAGLPDKSPQPLYAIIQNEIEKTGGVKRTIELLEAEMVKTYWKKYEKPKIRAKSGHFSTYKEKEVKYIIENFGLLTAAQIGLKLNRTAAAIRAHVCILRRQGKMKPHGVDVLGVQEALAKGVKTFAVAKMFRVHYSVITRIKSGNYPRVRL